MRPPIETDRLKALHNDIIRILHWPEKYDIQRLKIWEQEIRAIIEEEDKTKATEKRGLKDLLELLEKLDGADDKLTTHIAGIQEQVAKNQFWNAIARTNELMRLLLMKHDEIQRRAPHHEETHCI